MTPNQFIRRLRRLAQHQGCHFEVMPNRGKGSHAMVQYGNRTSVVPMGARELKKGTLNTILKQLELKEFDL